MTVRLSAHFTLEELTRSETAARLGIDNEPSHTELFNLRMVLVPGLERVRDLLGAPVAVSSGYRSRALNFHIPGSSATSAHCLGYAADIVCPAFGDAYAVCQAIAGSGLEFDQIIYEYRSWCHISFDPRLRRKLNTKDRARNYVKGLIR